MKKLILTLAISAIASTAYAGGGKTSILHCGCTEIGDAMVYKEISVSNKSKGHKNHVSSSSDACFVGYENDLPVYQDFIRIGDDCTLKGDGLDGLSKCDGFEVLPQPEDICSAVPIQ
jgi:hypothetical protein